jgi:hypothetical protein
VRMDFGANNSTVYFCICLAYFNVDIPRSFQMKVAKSYCRLHGKWELKWRPQGQPNYGGVIQNQYKLTVPIFWKKLPNNSIELTWPRP